MKSMKITDYAVSQQEFVVEYKSEYDCLKTNPVPDDLESYYDSSEYISHTDANNSIITKIYQLVKTFTIKKKEKLISKYINHSNKSILDIGSGTGSFLEYLNSKGWHSIGVEPNEKAKRLSDAKNVISVKNSSEIQNHTFDVISMWHVLEHVEDLKHQFQEFERLLNPDGIIVIAVPNHKSYDASYYKNFWAAYDVPRHIWHFSESSIKKISKKYGFQLIATKPMWFDSFYVSLLSEKYKTKKANFLRAFIIGLLSNLKALFSSQYSSKIYILSKKGF